VDREFQKRNLKLIAAWNWGEILVVITKDKHIRTSDDWKGRRLRIPPGAWVEAVKALGGTPVAIAPGEVYLAVERGVVEGALTGIDTGLVGWRLHEVAQFISFTKDFPNGGNIYMAMNLKRFQEMPKEVQDAILAAGREGSRGAGVDYVKKRRDILFERVPKMGGKLLIIPDGEVAQWRKAADPAVMKWYLEKGGPLAKEFADLVDRFKRERR
jgi:TRAP-type C4-dicarboxylate transport system substrate-binding protein